MVSSFSDNEGGATLVLQPTQVIVTVRGNFVYTDSYSRNLYIINITPDHKLGWLQYVPLSQHEASDPLYGGALVCHPNDKDLFLFFHDDKRNENPVNNTFATAGLYDSWSSQIQLETVHITADGTLTKNAVAQENDGQHHMAPHYPFGLYGNEIVYTSFNHRMLGRSTYKPGLIKIGLP